MGSQLNELNDLLKGEHPGPNKGAPGEGGVGASGLNQLSDAAAEIEVKPSSDQAAELAVPAVPVIVAGTSGHQVPAMALPSQGYSQEQLIEAAQPMQLQQPSQPDIPPPIMPESQGGSQQVHLNAEEAKNLLGAPQLDPYFMNQMMSAAGFNAMTLGDMLYGGMPGLNPHEDDSQQIGGNRSKGKKQTRRGPMDEMRQLIRILVKIFPHSINLITNTEEAGGGNRISEEQIKSYLDRALGEAPRPAWGVPNGWNGFLAELFSWATGKVVTGEECKRVARREPGRSWEAREDELHNLGVHPNCWPLPLTIEGIRAAEEKPIPIDVPKVPVVKRSSAAGGAAAGGGNGAAAGGGGGSGAGPSTAGGGGGGSASNKRARAAIERDLNKLDETDLWKFINDALSVAATKHNTAHDQTTVHAQKMTAKAKIDEFLGGGGGLSAMYPYIPVMAGLNDPNLLNLMHNAGLGGFDPNDQNQAAALAAAAAAAAGAGTMDSNIAAAAAASAAAGAVPPPAKRIKHEAGEAAEGTPANEAAAAAAGAHLGSLPMQPPPLTVTNYPNPIQNLTAYMTIPGLNMAMPATAAGINASEVANGAPAAQPEQPKQD